MVLENSIPIIGTITRYQKNVLRVGFFLSLRNSPCDTKILIQENSANSYDKIRFRHLFFFQILLIVFFSNKSHLCVRYLSKKDMQHTHDF